MTRRVRSVQANQDSVLKLLCNVICIWLGISLVCSRIESFLIPRRVLNTMYSVPDRGSVLKFFYIPIILKNGNFVRDM